VNSPGCSSCRLTSQFTGRSGGIPRSLKTRFHGQVPVLRAETVMFRARSSNQRTMGAASSLERGTSNSTFERSTLPPPSNITPDPLQSRVSSSASPSSSSGSPQSTITLRTPRLLRTVDSPGLSRLLSDDTILGAEKANQEWTGVLITRVSDLYAYGPGSAPSHSVTEDSQLTSKWKGLTRTSSSFSAYTGARTRHSPNSLSKRRNLSSDVSPAKSRSEKHNQVIPAWMSHCGATRERSPALRRWRSARKGW
jgi:hypothetical protein